MSEQIREQISAFLDGELPAAERALLLQRLARDPTLRAQWGRYQLIHDALHKGLPDKVNIGLADRVMAELESAPAYQGGVQTTALGRFFKPLAGLAVAASVAVVAVVAVQQTRTPETGAVQVAANAPAMPGPEAYKRVQGTHWDVDTPQVGNRLNEYLVNHNEYAASGGIAGMPPYVRIVGYDQE